MFRQSFQPVLNRIFAVATLILLSATVAWSGSYKVIHAFTRNSKNPSSGLVVDQAGNAYGTTAAGGYQGGSGGTVYQLSSKTGFRLIYGFRGPDGSHPQGNLVMDESGNLYGTTVSGGADKSGCNGGGCGTVFRLSPPMNNGASAETVLYSFSGGNDGANPQAGVILDAAGNLYGTTEFGGIHGLGTIFKLAPEQGDIWTETIILDVFEGLGPVGGLVFDNAGNLFGTTLASGPQRGGTVFELSPGPGETWTYKLIYAFNGFNGSKDASGPGATLIFDSAGNLYGTAEAGGEFGFGAVFELTLIAGNWTEKILYSFAGGNDGATPKASLVSDAAGNLYGTTFAGGGFGQAGTVFELTQNQNGQWTERRFRFPSDGSLGSQPAASLLLDDVGNVYGTTSIQGRINGGVADGVVFRITP